MAVWTGLEPATSAVTGRHSNQLNYQTIFIFEELFNYLIKLGGANIRQFSLLQMVRKQINMKISIEFHMLQ